MRYRTSPSVAQKTFIWVFTAVQAKLTVGPATDHYEQEADRVTDQVMLMAAPQTTDHRPAVQRQAEEEVQTKPLASTITPPGSADRRGAAPFGGASARPRKRKKSRPKPLAATISPLVQRQAEEEEEVQTQRQGPGDGFEAGSEGVAGGF